MRYDLSKSYDRNKVQEYLDKLIKEESKVELKKIYPKRSISANKYLHVLFNLWGKEFGYTIDETKETVKSTLNYAYQKEDNRGVRRTFFSRTSDMDSKELTIFIDKFRDWSAQTCDLYLPSPEEYMSEQIYFDNLTNK